MTDRTFVTVGAGQTAAVAARTLRRRGFDGRIILIGDEPHPPYQRPPLSKEYLSGAGASDDLWILPERWCADHNVEIRTGTEVTRVDTATGTVELSGQAPIRADAVLFATGGRPRRLPVPGPRPDLVHHLRTLDDAARLHEALTPGCRLGIIGAGFIGLEIAATAVGLGSSVTVLEAAAVPLGAVLGPRIGTEIGRLHRANGVQLHTGVAVDGLRTDADGVVVSTGAQDMRFDAVVIGIGITPNTAVAEASGIAVDDGIVVDVQGRASVPNVYAAGDVARRFSERAARHVRVEHFDNANRQGAAVANAMLGRDAVNDDAPWFWSDQYEHNLQLLGAATGDLVIRGDVEDLEFTAFYIDTDDTLRGVFTVDRGEDVMVGRELLGRRIPRAVLEDDEADLWELVDTEEVAQ
ncbi:NAD(P)/FAD-dependent oxidoreductase [Mycolicibacterium goodii]|uniref:FAD-dependent oxidoreductase n=1 Tax=Mycolicibacterium goodii TaxID=134601 RepID=A0ABS6HGD9_MYCGD|nr:FAD-dependent oxidoreductase [Mycolicibacterium goodii]MBU8821706.1 FAD-dependent oxidoreductase [Mycolicibacterium goodii]MBU8836698.1 FAD-dependent oxidoreductase [Mycolicibacterium goodii]